MPCVATWWRNASLVQFSSNCAHGGVSLGPNVLHDEAKVVRALIGVCFQLRHRVSIANLLSPEGPSAVRVPEALNARVVSLARHSDARLCGGEGALGVLGNGAAHRFSDRSDDVYGEPVRIGHVSRNEVHATLLKAGDEVQVAREPVEPGYDQLCSRRFGVADGRLELGSGVALSTLHLHVLGNKRGRSADEKATDRLTLRLKPKAASALLVRRNPEVGNKLCCCHRSNPVVTTCPNVR